MQWEKAIIEKEKIFPMRIGSWNTSMIRSTTLPQAISWETGYKLCQGIKKYNYTFLGIKSTALQHNNFERMKEKKEKKKFRPGQSTITISCRVKVSSACVKRTTSTNTWNNIKLRCLQSIFKNGKLKVNRGCLLLN